jgi:hypothetical protein
MAVVVSSPPEQGQLVTVRQRRYVVTDVAKSTLPERPLRVSGNGGQHLVSLSSVENDALGEELQVIWEIEPRYELEIRRPLDNADRSCARGRPSGAGPQPFGDRPSG